MKFLLTIIYVQMFLYRSEELVQKQITGVEKENIIVKCPIDSASHYTDDYNYDYDDLERKKRQSPIIIMQWFKDSAKLNQFTNIGKYEFEDHVLRILNVDYTDAGNYTCKLINGITQSSASINVVVKKINSSTKQIQISRPSQPSKKTILQRAPVFVASDRITKLKKQKGEDATLNCRAIGMPKPDILWFKNGIVLSEEEYGITR